MSTRKLMLALSLTLFIFAGFMVVTYVYDLGRPVDDTPMYPRAPDNEPPEVYFIPNVPIFRSISGAPITIHIIVVEWRNDIQFLEIIKYDVDIDGSLDNQTTMVEGMDYITSTPNSAGYGRKIFPGCRDEMKIKWTFNTRNTGKEIHVIAVDSAGNVMDYVYKFMVEAVQNAPEFYLNSPESFVMDEPMISVELVVTENETMISDVHAWVDGLSFGSLTENAGFYSTIIQSVNLPSGLHILEVRITLRSGLTMSYYTGISTFTPSLVPSIAPPLAIMFVIVGIIVLAVRREKRPAEEKILAGIRGKIYVVDEREKKRKKKKF